MGDLEVALRAIERWEAEAVQLENALRQDRPARVVWGKPVHISAGSRARILDKIADLRFKANRERDWVERYKQANGLSLRVHAPTNAVPAVKKGRKRQSRVKRLTVADPLRRSFQMADLTPRQQEVAGMLYAGTNPAAIAREMGLDRKTVKDHIDAITRKMAKATPIADQRRRRTNPTDSIESGG